MQYYNNRENILDPDMEWKNSTNKVTHPIQKDNHNCGVFVCFFIEQFLKEHNVISFNSSKKNLMKFRQTIADIIEANSDV